MTSAVDATFPADNVKTSKATFRAQMLTIKNEITALQQRTGVAGAKAFYGFVEAEDVRRMIAAYDTQDKGYARQIAFGEISL